MITKPLLETKLFAPRPGPGLVRRPHLSDRLTRGAQSRLTLVSAPPGFGKTTLLAEWLASERRQGRSTAWLSLDPADNEVAAFWAYLIAALQTVAPDVGTRASALLQEPQPPAVETILSTLVNELNAVTDDVVLVLDDYHAIDAPEIQEQVAFLVEHLPPQVHLVIVTRADPALPLARLRARGQLVEIRAADLRFTSSEAAAYLNEVMGLELGTSAVAALEARTEGWIAALQLAALSMRGRDDVPGFIAAFAGTDRYIVDYLAEEVLERQPSGIREFLLQTAILDRLSGPLCDAVTGNPGSAAMLEALDRRNLFVVALDDRREWYRYHQLFADVLRARLDEQPADSRELHRRASKWYGDHGSPAEAIEHAFAGQDPERAADLIEDAIPAVRQGRQLATMRRWLAAVPDELVAFRPVLAVNRAGLLLADGEIEGAERRLRDAEQWLGTTEGARDRRQGGSPGVVVRDEAAFLRLPSQIAMYRAALAQAAGDAAAATAQAQRALELAGDDDHFERGGAAGFLALAHWGSGQLEEAHGCWSDARASLEMAGHAVDAIGCLRAMARIRIAQGRLREAMATYRLGLQLATKADTPVLPGAADMHVGMSELFLEWNDLQLARQHLTASDELGEHAGLPLTRSNWRVAMARIREAEGDLDGALDLLDEAERVYVSEYYPDVRPIGALKARIWIVQGRLGEADAWVHQRGLSADDDLSYLREFGHITLARILMRHADRDRAAGTLPVAVGLLNRLLQAAEDGQRPGSVIEILLLLAIAHQRLGAGAAALELVERALAVGEPESWVRTFVAEGPPVRALLDSAARNGIAVDQVRRLQAAYRPASNTAPPRQALIEPLSNRELEVLRLLATELDGPGIAGELVVGLSTVRSHTKSIYAKLGVNSRRAAVRRGQELGLLSSASSR